MKVTIEEAAERLDQGGVVAFPTETVYGLGARADMDEAVANVFQTKGRPADNPLIVHLCGVHQVERFASDLSDAAKNLMKAFWPGPLTIVLRRRDQAVSDLVTGGLDTVALRVPAHDIALDLISRTGPLVAPSANPSGRPSPTRASHVEQDYGGSVAVLDGGATRIGVESTVVDCTSVPFRILRPGALDARSLEAAAGVPVTVDASDSGRLRSPGARYRHYTPHATVRWHEPDREAMAEDGIGGDRPSGIDELLVMHSRRDPPLGFEGHVVRFDGDFATFANRLYDLFRWADEAGLTTIWIERLPASERHAMLPALENRISKAIGDA